MSRPQRIDPADTVMTVDEFVREVSLGVFIERRHRVLRQGRFV